MNNLILILLLIIVFLIIFILFKIKNDKKDFEDIKLDIIKMIYDKTDASKQDILKLLYDNKENISKNINDFKEKINENNNDFSEKVKLELKDGFKETQITFKDLIERLTKIDSAQKNIEKLSLEVVSLQKILSDKKSRGSFGEFRLEQVLDYVYGDNKIYERQYKLSNGKIADFIIYINSKLKKVAIDSKFPLENYNKYIENNEFQKDFIKDVKKHIDDISNKYIINGETIDFAIMFLPSESIFLDICKNFEELIDYSYKKKVWLASQTNLIIYISTIQFASLEYEKNKNSEIILNQLVKFSEEFKRYYDRFEKIKKDFNNLEKDFRDLSITSEKIIKNFDNIQKIKIEEKIKSKIKIFGGK